MSEAAAQHLPKIGRPATTALANIGITTLADVAAYGRANLLQLHGIGPKALRLLDEALTQNHLTWEDQHHG